jgi:hypothetical protein
MLLQSGKADKANVRCRIEDDEDVDVRSGIRITTRHRPEECRAPHA